MADAAVHTTICDDFGNCYCEWTTDMLEHAITHIDVVVKQVNILYNIYLKKKVSNNICYSKSGLRCPNSAKHMSSTVDLD